jgi:hypothetical protein
MEGRLFIIVINNKYVQREKGKRKKEKEEGERNK